VLQPLSRSSLPDYVGVPSCSKLRTTATWNSRRIEDKPKLGRHRWVVERTLSWLAIWNSTPDAPRTEHYPALQSGAWHFGGRPGWRGASVFCSGRRKGRDDAGVALPENPSQHWSFEPATA